MASEIFAHYLMFLISDWMWPMHADAALLIWQWQRYRCYCFRCCVQDIYPAALQCVVMSNQSVLDHDGLLCVQVYQTQQQIERLEKQHAQHERENGSASSSQQQRSSMDAQGTAGHSTGDTDPAAHSSADAASQVGGDSSLSH